MILNCQNFEGFFKQDASISINVCDVDVYDKDHLSGPEDRSGGGSIPCPIASYKEALESLDHTINFIDNWLRCFEENMMKE